MLKNTTEEIYDGVTANVFSANVNKNCVFGQLLMSDYAAEM